jgi:phage recombination protein Bet
MSDTEYALATIDGQALSAPALRFNREQLDLLKNTIAAGTSDLEFELFTQVCKATGLNPFARQIHPVMRRVKDGDKWVDRMTIQTGIDGFRLIAQRTGEYRGQVGPEWCGPDGAWRDVWLETDPPAAARVGIWREGFVEPVWGVATWKSYCQTRQDGQATAQWARQGDNMLAKCAEAQGLRKAFPQELSGLYSDEEMQQADSGAGDGEPRKPNQAPPKRGSRASRPDPEAPSPGAEAAFIDGTARPVHDEPAISRFWRDVRAMGLDRAQVVAHLKHERFEELDDDALGELLIQLRDKHGNQAALGV